MTDAVGLHPQAAYSSVLALVCDRGSRSWYNDWYGSWFAGHDFFGEMHLNYDYFADNTTHTHGVVFFIIDVLINRNYN